MAACQAERSCARRGGRWGKHLPLRVLFSLFSFSLSLSDTHTHTHTHTLTHTHHNPDFPLHIPLVLLRVRRTLSFTCHAPTFHIAGAHVGALLPSSPRSPCLKVHAPGGHVLPDPHREGTLAHPVPPAPERQQHGRQAGARQHTVPPHKRQLSTAVPLPALAAPPVPPLRRRWQRRWTV